MGCECTQNGCGLQPQLKATIEGITEVQLKTFTDGDECYKRFSMPVDLWRGRNTVSSQQPRRKRQLRWFSGCCLGSHYAERVD
ncbi:hypothetical protein TNCV_2314461 [Trichonephila clavipes]|nr:hypothetical protein TNCV_2314461 [Trichonephila clavipes]